MKHNMVRMKQDPKREAANREAEQHRGKKKAARQANAEKQKRYRESMKAQGYKAKLIWEKPLETGWIRAAAPVIRESSLNVAANNPAMKEVLGRLPGIFIHECEKQKIDVKVWELIYRDLLCLIKPLEIEE